jgi:hypothetical protein
MLLLPQPPKFWGHRYASSCLAFVLLFKDNLELNMLLDLGGQCNIIGKFKDRRKEKMFNK